MTPHWRVVLVFILNCCNSLFCLWPCCTWMLTGLDPSPCLSCCCLRQLLADYCLFWLLSDQFDPTNFFKVKLYLSLFILFSHFQLAKVLFSFWYLYLLVSYFVDASPWNDRKEAIFCVSTTEALTSVAEVYPFQWNCYRVFFFLIFIRSAIFLIFVPVVREPIFCPLFICNKFTC